ncbi:MAG: hypothetical protein K6A90_07450 [Lachnospiraceae bacterium]|nr:hypothetical protein [Lachnospiraceae bacterium]
MIQELIAGIIMAVMGLCMILIPPGILWKITEGWKTKTEGQPSKLYIVVVICLGIVFALTGGYLIKLAVK